MIVGAKTKDVHVCRFDLTRALITICLVWCFGLPLVACSETTAQPPPADRGGDGGGGQPTVDRGEGGTAGNNMAGDTAATSPPDSGPVVEVPPELVPVERLTGDAKKCPIGFAQQLTTSGAFERFSAGDQNRSFVMLLPPSTFKGPRPLFVAFNGTRSTGAAFIASARLNEFVDAGFIVLAPNSRGNGYLWPAWDSQRTAEIAALPNPDLAFFDSLIGCVATQQAIDKNRIYVGGLSAGGTMTNALLQHRSELLAGGIVGSGVFDFTTPIPAPALQPLAVLVTWGGANDIWSGASESPNVSASEANFDEQAALATAFWEKAESVGILHTHCKGHELGHRWLSDNNKWMIDYLLAHPKGAARNNAWKFTQPAPGSKATCSEGASMHVSLVKVSCQSPNAGCQAYCQFIGDCAVEADGLRPNVSGVLSALGFTGPKHEQCGGCVQTCVSDLAAGGALEETVLSCIKANAPAACPGLGTGAFNLLDGPLATCCSQKSSRICARICEPLIQSAVSPFLRGCAAWK